MRSKCFDIGVIQAFVDGELGLEETSKVVRHVSVCEHCTLQAAELESENEAAFAALDCELNRLVPTERLRQKVLTSIRDGDAKKSGWWTGLLAGIGPVGVIFRPGAAAFTSAILIFGFIGGVLWFGFSPFESPVAKVSVDEQTPPEIASPESTGTAEIVSLAADSQEVSQIEENSGIPGSRTPVPLPAGNASRGVTVSRVIHRPVRKAAARARVANAKPAAFSTEVAVSPSLEAEDGYLRTIATLNRTVNENKDFVLRPSERVGFERDLAVVNDAIRKMRSELEKDPNNTGAREVLKSSYKNKIELLNSVAERSEVVASLD